MNYINNKNILINIEQLNSEIKDTFWFGLITGAVGVLFITCYLKNKRTESDKT